MIPMPSLHPTGLGTLLLVGRQEALADAVIERLQRDGFDVLALNSDDEPALNASLVSAPPFDALVVLTPAGRSPLGFDQIGDAAFEAALDEQLFAVVRTGQAVLPHLSPGARIVHVGSRGHLGAWGGVHRMAASAGLAAMTRSMALELQPEGLCVNLVASEFTHDRQDTPANRAAVAHAVSLLAAPGAGITGQCVVVDGLAGLRMSESRQPHPAAIPVTP